VCVRYHFEGWEQIPNTRKEAEESIKCISYLILIYILFSGYHLCCFVSMIAMIVSMIKELLDHQSISYTKI
jgi:uncharacterized membrane protein